MTASELPIRWMGNFASRLVRDSCSAPGANRPRRRPTVSGPTLSDAAGLLHEARVADLPVRALVRSAEAAFEQHLDGQ
jgi:hypothetical protein